MLKIKFKKLFSIFILISLVINLGILSSLINPVSAQIPLTFEWQAYPLGSNARTNIQPLAADLIPSNPGLEIVTVGGVADYSGNGAIHVLDGDTGAVIWEKSYASDGAMYYGMGSHTPFEIADLDLDGLL